MAPPKGKPKQSRQFNRNDKAKAEAVRNAEELEASKKQYQMEWSDFSNLFAQGTQLEGAVAGTGNVRRIQMEGLDYAAKMMEKDNPGIHEKQWLAETTYLMKLNKYHHANIIRLVKMGRVDQLENGGNGKFYLVYELMTSSVMAKIDVLNWEDIKKILQDTASGLKFLHSHNICHNDIKPDNLLFDEAYNVKIGDFGNATAPGQTPLLETKEYLPKDPKTYDGKGKF